MTPQHLRINIRDQHLGSHAYGQRFDHRYFNKNLVRNWVITQMAIKKYKTSPSWGPDLLLGIEYQLQKKIFFQFKSNNTAVKSA